MDVFTEKVFWLRLTIVLVVLNCVLLGFIVWKFTGKHHEPELFPGGKYRDVSGVLKKELDLTEDQAEKIKNLRDDYFQKESDIARIIRQKRDSMNIIMFNENTDDSLMNSLAAGIAENEYRMEQLRYAQAKEFKAICTPEQMAKFKNLVIEIRDYFRPDNKPGK